MNPANAPGDRLTCPKCGQASLPIQAGVGVHFSTDDDGATRAGWILRFGGECENPHCGHTISGAVVGQ